MSDKPGMVDDELAGGVAEAVVRKALGGDPDDDDDRDPEPEPEPLTPAQLAAVESLASGGTVSAAAKAAGIERLAVDDWLANHPMFIAELNARRRDRLDQVQGRLRNLADKAVATIERMLDDESLPAAVRLKVVQIVLDASGGIPKAEPIGPCDPAGAERAVKHRKHEEWLDSIRI
jgi:hypothetical protein